MAKRTKIMQWRTKYFNFTFLISLLWLSHVTKYFFTLKFFHCSSLNFLQASGE